MYNIMFVSLGCDKNLVDTEKMIGMLNADNTSSENRVYTFTDDEYEADIVIVNTCCFIGDAKVESINTLIELGALKNDPTAHLKYLVAAGCLAKRYRDEILSEIPEIDALVDVLGVEQISEIIRELTTNGTVDSDRYLIKDSMHFNGARELTSGGFYAYLKIAEGCDKHCTYCVIPKVRGAYRSVPMEDIIEEAKFLASRGVKELMLIAQEITCYGIDLYGKKMLPALLKELCKIEEIRWVRLLYCYPEEITEELIEVMANEEKIVHYIDMPIQHCSDTILKKMGRRTTKSDIVSMIDRLREAMPDIAIRTTLITGFPGETQKEHEEMLDFVDEMEFDRLGVFPYSCEEDTAAALLPDQIDEELKKERANEVMELQQEIAFSQAESMKDCELLVMIEGKVVDEPVYIGRTYKDAPKVDGYVFVDSDVALMSGDFVKVRITGAQDYDLIGEMITDEDESAE